MSQIELITESRRPNTRTSLANDLRSIGIEAGMTVLVHSSMKAIGWTSGGAIAMIQALQDVLSPTGTLVMPTHSADVSDPKEWRNPALPESWINAARSEMPAFDRALTPTFHMGILPELFRTFPSVKRSNHPMHSFSAWGQERDEIINNHALDHGLGEDSPLGAVYRLKGYVLMLGTSYLTNTSMHLGEHKTPIKKTIQHSSPIMNEGEKVWRSFTELDYDEGKFADIGKAFEQAHLVKSGLVGYARTKLISQPELVDFTANYLRGNPLYRNERD